MATTPNIGWAGGTAERTRGRYRTENVQLRNACKAAYKLLGLYSWVDGDGGITHGLEPFGVASYGPESHDVRGRWQELRTLLEVAGVASLEGEPLPLIGDAVFLRVQSRNYVRAGVVGAYTYTYGDWVGGALFEVLRGVNSYGYADGEALDLYYGHRRVAPVRVVRDVVPVAERERYLAREYVAAQSEVIGEIAPFTNPVIASGWAVIGDLSNNPQPDFGVRESLLVIPTGYPGMDGRGVVSVEHAGVNLPGYLRVNYTDGAPTLLETGIVNMTVDAEGNLTANYPGGASQFLVRLPMGGGSPPPPPAPPPPLAVVYGSEPVYANKYIVLIPAICSDEGVSVPVWLPVDVSITGGDDAQALAWFMSVPSSLDAAVVAQYQALGGGLEVGAPSPRAILVALAGMVVLASCSAYGELQALPLVADAGMILGQGLAVESSTVAGPGEYIAFSSVPFDDYAPLFFGVVPEFLLWRGSLVGDVVGVRSITRSGGYGGLVAVDVQGIEAVLSVGSGAGYV